MLKLIRLPCRFQQPIAPILPCRMSRVPMLALTGWGSGAINLKEGVMGLSSQ